MGKTVLIVEDEQSIVDILSYILTKEGYDTLEALDGPTGLQLALEQNPDLVLLDLMLPGLSGEEVLAKIEGIPVMVVSAKVGDCTNEEVLRSFSVESFDACFVCLGDNNVLGSLQITSLLKELGAKKVFSKADDDVQAKFLLRNGADSVIYPEREAALRLAVSESSDSIFDCIPLTSDHSIYELEPMDRWIGKSLKELNFRVKYHLTVVGVKRGDVVIPNLSPDYAFRKDEHLLVLGRIEDIRKVTR